LSIYQDIEFRPKLPDDEYFEPISIELGRYKQHVGVVKVEKAHWSELALA
jgi:hypothetical protein